MKYIPFPLSYKELLSIESQEKRDALTLNHWKNNEAWFHYQLNKLNCDYLTVGGTSGKIYRHSQMQDFPDEQELEKLLNETGEIPFSWSKPFPVEELAA